jgi:hypothetical protein
MKDAVFWDMATPCSSFKKLRFGGKYHLHLQGEKLRVALFLIPTILM